LVALNLGDEPAAVDFPVDAISGRVLLSSHCDRENELVSNSLALRPNEGVVIDLTE
jgi:alpha-glucosidase